MRLLVVEDDVALAAVLGRGLDEEGHQVQVVASCAAAERALGDGWDVIILDWGLPDGDGVTLLGRWRRRGDATPVLMLTARGQVGERVTGLRSGADDYLTKPFDFEELLARVDALGRRGRRGGELRAGRLALDERGRQARLDDTRVDLSPRELDVLRVLMERSGDVVTRAELLDVVWGHAFTGPPNVVDVYVGYLRGKLRPLDASVRIETVRGLGYRLVVSP